MNSFTHAFPGQEKHEAMYVFARPYVLAFLPTTVLYVAIIGFSILGQWAVRFDWLYPLDHYYANIGIALLGVLQLFGTIVYFVALLEFYYDIFLVTDRQLTDIEQRQLLSRSYSKLSLEDVEDVSAEVKGLFPTLFQYGTILIQTAGEKMNFRVENIRYPYDIAAMVLDLSEQAKRGVADDARFPEKSPVGYLNNRVIETAQGLIEMGAMDADDPRAAKTPQA